jgi:hypothetical protein
MRFILFSVAVGLCAAPLRAELPELLNEACMNVSRDTERWAYTETTITTDQKGRSKGETVVHVDPSKPYAEQFTPIKINGKAPTERQLKQYRSKGERHGQELERRERQGRPEHPVEPPRININEATGALDLDHITVVEENAQSITYEIPLHPDDRHRLPLEKLQLWLRVRKEQHTLENVTIRVRSPFRVKVVAKINAGEFGMDFATVDPQFAPPLTALHGDLAASMLFMKASAKVEMKRTDFQRVKPYNDHFQVKVGPLQFIIF